MNTIWTGLYMKFRLKEGNLKKNGQLTNETNQRKAVSHFEITS